MDPDERVPRYKEFIIRVKPDFYLNRAHEELSNGNDVQALENYVNYLENLINKDDMNLEEQLNLTKLVLRLGSALEAEDVDDEVMKCYVGILNHFPKNVLILNAFGAYLFSKGEYNVAKGYFQTAAAEGHLPAEKNLLHVLWNLIPRWHFRMLNDSNRNKAYQKSIHKAIKSGCKNVFDIGAGCGLFTLIAATFDKDVRVTAFEENRPLHDIAKKIFKEYNLNNVTLFLQNSNKVLDTTVPCNLIVTEIFDAALFGENCLESISHALDVFVKDEKFQIIPASARLYVTGIESVTLSQKTRYTETLPELGLVNICIREIEPEPYDSEYLRSENVKYMTETKAFLNVNFYDKVQLRSLLANSYSMDEIEVVCQEEGTIHAFAVWFDLNLDDEISFSTSPFNTEIQCWEQAVFHLQHPIQVKKGEILKVKPNLIDNHLNFKVLNRHDNCQSCYKVSKEVISFLNDTELIKTVTRAVNSYETHNLNIVDFSIIPLFGFLMAQKGAVVHHVYKETHDMNFFVKVNELNNCQVIFIDEKALQDYIVYLQPPNIVYTDWIKTDGSWNKVELSLEIESKLKCENLPKKIFLNAQLVNSDYLDVCNKVDDSKALNFRISELMNEFSGTEHPNLGDFPHEKCSSVVAFDISNLEVMDFHSEANIITDGVANGIFYWFNVQVTDDESITFSTLNSSHYGKICTIFKNPKHLKKGDNIMIHILRSDGYLKVYCD